VGRLGAMSGIGVAQQADQALTLLAADHGWPAGGLGLDSAQQRADWLAPATAFSQVALTFVRASSTPGGILSAEQIRAATAVPRRRGLLQQAVRALVWAAVDGRGRTPWASAPRLLAVAGQRFEGGRGDGLHSIQC